MEYVLLASVVHRETRETRSKDSVSVRQFVFDFGLRIFTCYRRILSYMTGYSYMPIQFFDSRNLLFFQIFNFKFSRFPMIFRCSQLSHIKRIFVPKYKIFHN
jgi:hypothetical protein